MLRKRSDHGRTSGSWSAAALAAGTLLGGGLLALPAAVLDAPWVAFAAGILTLVGMLALATALLLPGRLSGLRWHPPVGTGLEPQREGTV